MGFTTLLPLLTLGLSLIAPATAQTWSSCNPMNQTDCTADPALSTNATFNWTQVMADDDVWNVTNGQLEYDSSGGKFIIRETGDSPTIQSQFYIFFGVVSVIMRAAKGTGIVSSIVLESDDLDEVDWELIGGNNTHVESNYFGKGNTTSYDRAIWHPLDDPQGEFHNYTTVWTAEKLEWYIDNDLVRTLKYADALNGQNYPQTPMNIRLGIWAGGDSKSEGTVEWAGGKTDYSDAPFTMTVQAVHAQDYSTGKEYVYGDKTGSYESIKVVNGTSRIKSAIDSPSGLKAHYKALSSTAKIGIAAGAGGLVLVLSVLMLFCCIKQRRAGRLEHKSSEAEFEKGVNELKEYRQRMTGGGFAESSQPLNGGKRFL